MKNFVWVILIWVAYPAFAQIPEYSILGEINAVYDGQTVFLTNTDNNEVSPDSTVIRNGRFRFNGPETPNEIYVVSLGRYDRTTVYGDVVLERGEIRMLLDSFPVRGGTPLNDRLQEYEEINRSAGHTSDAMIRFIEKNSTNKIGQAAFCWSYQNWTDLQVNEILSVVDENFRSDENVAMCLKSREILKNIRGQEKIREKVVGTKYTDFELVTPEGETKCISDYVGKTEYLLIDFWTSWCGPCIKGMPFIKTKGFFPNFS